MRLIDADALMEVIREHDYPLRSHFNSTDNGMFTLGIQQAVYEAPTIEPVKWISVSERLPEQPPDYFKNGHWWMVSGEDFIVADSDGKVYEAHWTYGCSCQRYFWYVNSLTPLKNITHWMPLPDPPKEDVCTKN